MKTSSRIWRWTTGFTARWWNMNFAPRCCVYVRRRADVLSENDLLLRLMADSVSTFCVLFRHALRLGGEQPSSTSTKL